MPKNSNGSTKYAIVYLRQISKENILKRRFKRILQLNTFLTASIIAADLFLLHHHNEPESHVRQVTTSKKMLLKPISKLRSIQVNEEEEFSDK